MCATFKNMKTWKCFKYEKYHLNNDKTLLNILESLLADNIESQQPIDLQFRQSLGESRNSQLKSNTNENKKERMLVKLISKNILH